MVQFKNEVEPECCPPAAGICLYYSKLKPYSSLLLFGVPCFWILVDGLRALASPEITLTTSGTIFEIFKVFIGYSTLYNNICGWDSRIYRNYNGYLQDSPFNLNLLERRKKEKLRLLRTAQKK